MELFGNNAATTLNGGITSVATSLVVASSTNFPTAGNFRILVDAGVNLEYMLVTAVSGTTFTVTRGVEGTTGVAHSGGVQVVQVITSGAFASSTWATAFDLDFTALTTATLNGGADGTFTFAGAPAGANYTWTKVNSVNEAPGAHANIVNGSGLNFQPASAGDYNGPTRTNPLIWLPFAQVFPSGTFPNFGWNTKLRLWVAVGTDNLSAVYDNEIFGIDSNSLNFGAALKRGYGFGGPPTGGASIYLVNNTASNNFIYDAYTPATGNKTHMMEFESVAAMWFKTFRGTALSAGQAFPNVSTLSGGTYDQFGLAPNPTGTSVTFASTGVTDPLNGMGVVLGAERGGSGTALSVFFLRMRLDYKLQD